MEVLLPQATGNLAPALTGEVERVVLWIQVLTGMELGADGEVQVRTEAAWPQRRQRLRELGGPPMP